MPLGCLGTSAYGLCALICLSVPVAVPRQGDGQTGRGCESQGYLSDLLYSLGTHAGSHPSFLSPHKHVATA